MSLTVAELAEAIRAGADDDGALPDAQQTLLNRVHGAAVARVNKAAPAAPEDVRDEATILLASHLYDRPGWSEVMGPPSAYVNSGAAALLKPWRVKRARPIGGDE